jgi:hypothetical protein
MQLAVSQPVLSNLSVLNRGLNDGSPTAYQAQSFRNPI